MRRSEYASAILVAIVAMAVTAMVMSLLLGLIGRQQAKVEDVSGVMVTGQQGVTVNRRVFHERALNPTVEVYVEGHTEATNQTRAEGAGR